jgi:hypothetical protein
VHIRQDIFKDNCQRLDVLASESDIREFIEWQFENFDTFLRKKVEANARLKNEDLDASTGAHCRPVSMYVVVVCFIKCMKSLYIICSFT